MFHPILLSASPANVEACAQLARENGLGIEMMAFAYPDVLDGNWCELVARYQALLEGIALRTLHGPFFDMVAGSLDKRIEALTRERYQQALDIAALLNVRTVIFHANFIAAMRNVEYRHGFHKRGVLFWRDLAHYGQEKGVTVAVENMWEFEPNIIVDVVAEIDHPCLKVCLDVGHAHLFSDVPFQTWLDVTAPWVAHVHLNNNDGRLDHHRALQDGRIDYQQLLPRLSNLPLHPTFTLEMDSLDDMRASLPMLGVTSVVAS